MRSTTTLLLCACLALGHAWMPAATTTRTVAGARGATTTTKTTRTMTRQQQRRQRRRRPFSPAPLFGELEDELNAVFAEQQPKQQPPPGIALQDGAVPQEQQPAQELKDLQAAPVFGWAQLPDEEFVSRFKYLFGAVWLFVSLPISSVSFPLDQAPMQAILAANFGTLAFLSVLSLRLYFGWSYVADRLTTDVGYYEQSGWYDGFLSVKPAEIRQRDQLLFEFEVEPALKRVTTYGAVMAGACVASFLLFRFAAPNSPDGQYDEAYLNTLYGDDAAAMREMQRAQKDVGLIDNQVRPTYCNDRYYRARAGGGGC